MKIDGLTFVESVERLADKYGVQLRREEGGPDDRPKGPQRRRLIEAHAVAQEFYAEHLADAGRRSRAASSSLSAASTRRRPRTSASASRPRDGESLWHHLRDRKFSLDEVVAAGLVAVGRGPYDRFRGRLLWPIRETSGDTIGFGARRIFDDDKIEAKYLNTPETPIYKKSQVLYGVDLARRDMARTSQAVIVEGYTDVMACHLAGVTTAVATCGTAFGDEHAKVLRRLLADHEEFRGEVIFTFDGDAAGQKAALKVFQGDQQYVAQTYVAVAPDGMDPCDLRIKQGDAAVRELIATRQPLYRFVLANVVGRYDLDRADSRVDALREAARLVASVRDKSKVDAFARELAGLVGVDPEEARTEVRRAAARGPRARRRGPLAAEDAGGGPTRAPTFPTCATRGSASSARPSSSSSSTRSRSAARPPTSAPTTSPTRPTGRCGRWSRRPADPPPATATRAGSARSATAATDPAVASAVSALAVEPIPTTARARRVVRRALRVPPPRAHDAAADRRAQVAPPAHQPGERTRPTTTRCSASSPPSSSTAVRSATGSSAREDVGPTPAVAGPR